MKVLLTVGPAKGILNHCIALTKLLTSNDIEVSWITGEQSREHLDFVNFSTPCFYSSTHDIDFNRSGIDRKPHLQQVCDLDYLAKSTEFELSVMQKIRPDMVITKHHYSSTISSGAFGVPYATFYTDGGEYLIEGRNPQEKNSTPELIQNYLKLCKEYGLNRPAHSTVLKYLTSPFLNIIRGVPSLSSLSKKEISALSQHCIFGGLLTYDGISSPQDKSLMNSLNKNKPIIYATFGTIAHDSQRYHMLIEALAQLDATIVMSTVNVDPAEFKNAPHNIIVKRYIPNNLIMEKADLVIHHGGHGTLLTACQYGVPQIIIPDNEHSSAQTVHAKMLQDCGFGLLLNKSTLTSDSLKKVVIDILGSDRKHLTSLKHIINEENTRSNANLMKRINTLIYEREEIRDAI